jgi:hypothetical protein
MAAVRCSRKNAPLIVSMALAICVACSGQVSSHAGPQGTGGISGSASGGTSGATGGDASGPVDSGGAFADSAGGAAGAAGFAGSDSGLTTFGLACRAYCEAAEQLHCPNDMLDCSTASCPYPGVDKCRAEYANYFWCLAQQGPTAFECNQLGRSVNKSGYCESEGRVVALCVQG